MKPLVELMGELRVISGGRNVPKFDPDDGGVDAEVLLLFQDPGPAVGTAKKKGTGFISEDNPDPTALRVKNIKKSTGLHRTRTLAWNAVPWEIEEEERDSEFERVKSEKCLTKLLNKFDEDNDLRAVALFGKEYVWAFADEVNEARSGLKIFETYHPGDRAVNRWSHVLPHIKETIRQIKEFLDS